MKEILISPPVVFTIIFFGILGFAFVLSLFTYHGKRVTEDICKAYACGEDVKDSSFQPDYSQFFPFAFFFTILHIIALMITTIPRVTPGSLLMSLVYFSSAVISLLIFFRKR